VKNFDIIYSSINFIEHNIENELTAEIVSRNVGYSEVYFSKLFEEMLGTTIGAYIEEQRLVHASKEIIKGHDILDVVIKYGYETHIGFDTAYKVKYGYPSKLIYVMKLAGTIFKEIDNITMNHEILYKRLTEVINEHLKPDELEQLEEAYQFAIRAHQNQKRYAGEPYIIHPLNVAILLASAGLSFDAILVGLLHDTLLKGSSTEYKDLENSFGINIADRVKKCCESEVSVDLFNTDELFVYIKLADQLHNLETLDHIYPNRWNEKVMEILAVFSPIAATSRLKGLNLELEPLTTMINLNWTQ